MHELSFAENIVDIVKQSVAENELDKVRIVRMNIGDLSGVVADSLDFCFTAITADTSLSGAHLEIRQIPFTVRCNACQKESVNDLGFMICPACGATETTIIAGRELQVTEIELDTVNEITP
ncbi:MAG TPA: hydrogenase maturation nickel metallochaperone HypA [Bacteroidota bacterium]|nr:hydrogenase maturation nickel metallochaperone HypA [Bacteroidota bacterium]